MSAIRTKNRTEACDQDFGEGSSELRSHSAVPEANLVVLPRPRGDGLQAWVRGRPVELADPTRGNAFTPTPDDLLVSALASGLAWSARAFLVRHGLNDYVTVSARWSTYGNSLGDMDVDLRVTVVNLSVAERDALQAQLEAAVPPHLARRQIDLVLDPHGTASACSA